MSTAANRVEIQFQQFLSTEPVPLQSSGDVRALLEHAAQCEYCGRLLKEHPRHAELLLGLYDEGEAEQPSEDGESSLRPEIEASADELLANLPLSLRRAFAAPVSSDRAKFFLEREGGHDPSRLRAALVVSESLLAFGTIVDRGGLTIDRSAEIVASRTTRVPFRALAERISGSAECPDGVADILWTQVLALLSRGLAGLPGFYVVESDSNRIIIDEETVEIPLETVDSDELGSAFASMAALSEDYTRAR